MKLLFKFELTPATRGILRRLREPPALRRPEAVDSAQIVAPVQKRAGDAAQPATRRSAISAPAGSHPTIPRWEKTPDEPPDLPSEKHE